MNIIILGFGHICKMHYLKWCAVNPLIDRIYIYDEFINKKKIDNYISTNKIYRNIYHKIIILERTNNIEDIFSSNSFQKAFILTNNTSHFYLAEMALENYCDVLVEKPITITSKGFKILEKKAISKNKNLFPAYHQFYRSETIFFINKIKEFLKSNYNFQVNISAGNNKGFPIHSMQNGFSKKENAGGGVLIDLGSHYISLLFFFLYESGYKELEFQEINTNLNLFGNIKPNNVEEKFIASFRNKNILVNIDFSYKNDLKTKIEFKNKSNNLNWPKKNLDFSNLAFKNMIYDFIENSGENSYSKLLKSNYYISISKSINLIEKLYKLSGYKFEEKIY